MESTRPDIPGTESTIMKDSVTGFDAKEALLEAGGNVRAAAAAAGITAQGFYRRMKKQGVPAGKRGPKAIHFDTRESLLMFDGVICAAAGFSGVSVVTFRNRMKDQGVTIMSVPVTSATSDAIAKDLAGASDALDRWAKK